MTTDPFDMALNYIGTEWNDLTRLRDQRAMNARDCIEAADVTGALAAQLDVARLEGRIEGLNTAGSQLRMARAGLNA